MFKVLTYKRPVSMIILVDIFAFLLLYLYGRSFDTSLLYAALVVISIIIAVDLVIVKRAQGDEYLFLITAMLTSLGFLMIYRLDRSLGLKQIFWFAIGILLFYTGFFLYNNIKALDKLMFYYTAVSIAMFAATLVFGKNIHGSTNWISVMGHSFQPSEAIKVLFVLSFACYYGGAEQHIFGKFTFSPEKAGFKGKLLLSLITYVYIGFLILQKEWGTSVLLFLIYLSFIFVFENDSRLYVINAIFAVAAGYGGYHFVDHIKVRVDMWLNPWSDISGKGYQITQSLFAIAAGGFFGTGIGMGRPDMIPEVNTDFIFSAICEEMGIFGGVAVILLYFILCYRGFKIVLTSPDRFDRAVSLGVTVMFSVQTFIIIGGVIRLIPLTGITLPFISYGGSSLTTNFLALGLLQAVSSGRRKRMWGEDDAVRQV